MNKIELYVCLLDGRVRVVHDGKKILKSEILASKCREVMHDDELSRKIRDAIREYAQTGFLDPSRFELDLSGFSDFRKRVYLELLKTKPGETITYSELAARAGRPTAARAVGSAMTSNRFMLFVPCHRVVAKGGPSGWSGPPGWKEKLLYLEKRAASS